MVEWNSKKVLIYCSACVKICIYPHLNITRVTNHYFKLTSSIMHQRRPRGGQSSSYDRANSSESSLFVVSAYGTVLSNHTKLKADHHLVTGNNYEQHLSCIRQMTVCFSASLPEKYEPVVAKTTGRMGL